MILSSLKLLGKIIRQPRVARISLIVLFWEDCVAWKMIAQSNWSSLPKQIFSLESKWLQFKTYHFFHLMCPTLVERPKGVFLRKKTCVKYDWKVLKSIILGNTKKSYFQICLFLTHTVSAMNFKKCKSRMYG